MQRLNFASRLRASCSIGGPYIGGGDNEKYTMEIRPAFRDLNSQDQDHYMLSTVKGLIWVPREVPVVDDTDSVGERVERDFDDPPIVKSKTQKPAAPAAADEEKEFCFLKRKPPSAEKKSKSYENIKATPFPPVTGPQPGGTAFGSPLNFGYEGTRSVPDAPPAPSIPLKLHPQLKYEPPIKPEPVPVRDFTSSLNFEHEGTRPVPGAPPALPIPLKLDPQLEYEPPIKPEPVQDRDSTSSLNLEHEGTRPIPDVPPASSLSRVPGVEVSMIQSNESSGTAMEVAESQAGNSSDLNNEDSVMRVIDDLMKIYENPISEGMTNVIFNEYRLPEYMMEAMMKVNGNDLLGANGLIAREYGLLFNEPVIEFKKLRLLALYTVTAIVLDNVYNETRQKSSQYYENLKVFDKVAENMSMRPILPMFTVAPVTMTKKDIIETYYHMFYNYFAPVSERYNERQDMIRSPKCPEFYFCRLKCMCMLATAWFIDWMSTTVDSFEYQMQLFYHTRVISRDVKDDSRETRIKLRDSLMEKLPFARLFQLLWMHVLLNAAKFSVSSIHLPDDLYVKFSETVSTPFHICQLMGITERVWSEMKIPLTIQAREIYKSVVCEREITLKEHESHIELLLLLVENHLLHERSDDPNKWRESWNDPNFFAKNFNTEAILRDDRYQVDLFQEMIPKFFNNSYKYSFEPQKFNDTERKIKEQNIMKLFKQTDIHYEETDDNELDFLANLWREE